MQQRRWRSSFLILSMLALAACRAGAAPPLEGPPGAQPPFDDADACAWRMPPSPSPGRHPWGPAGGPAPPFGPAFGPAQEVIHTAIEIEHLYRQQGKPGEVAVLYRGLLAHTQDPQVRSFAFAALARAQQQPGDAEQAIATLKQSLDEDLQRLAAATPAKPAP